METFTRLNDAADFILSKFPNTLSMATPLGLGKPNQLINLLYSSVKVDKSRHLKIFTALSLDIPEPKSVLEARFTGPFFDRHFGKAYPRLEYLKDVRRGKCPPNIEIEEFYFQAGQWIGTPQMQGAYNSLNYTHVVRSLFNSGVEVVVQLIAASSDGKRFSLSCNPDLTLDLVDLCKAEKKSLLVVGVIHPDLPFLGGDAEVPPDFFQVLVNSPEVQHQLFAPPRAPLDREEYLIGLHASQLLLDDGTLQIGIGALSDALVYSTLLRHQDNAGYLKILGLCQRGQQRLSLSTEPFIKGLYGTSEMIMDGFMQLRNAGILAREVLDGPKKLRRYLHGAFLLGSKDFYQWLRELSPTDFAGLSMTRVSKVNDLYDPDELALRRQRKNARFFNTCMNVTLLGAAASETLENGQVLSGVGGQYNFVAMSQELSDSHSILMLRSTRTSKGKRTSNIVWSHGHLTIPRHLRDVVITEYGMAALRGENDQTVIQRLLNITDSAFQEELLATAKRNGKVPQDYLIPEWARDNTPERVSKFFEDSATSGLFPRFPFGSDFTAVEERLQKALVRLKDSSPLEILKVLAKGLSTSEKMFSEEHARMGFLGFPHWFYKKLLNGALALG